MAGKRGLNLSKKAWEQLRVNLLHNYSNVKSFAQREHFISQFCQLNAKESKKGGVLYTVCIPKEKFFDCGYISLSYGIPYEEQSKECLESMQQEMLANLYDPKGRSMGPQVRLLAHKLEENPVFMFSTMSDHEISDLSSKINALCSRLDRGHNCEKQTHKII